MSISITLVKTMHDHARKVFLPLMLFGAIFLSIPQASASQTLDQYAQTILNRYSRNFEQRGFRFAQPDYRFPEFTVATKPRYIMLIASTFRYRAQAGDARALAGLRKGIAPTVLAFKSKPRHPSFEDSQAAFLLVRMMDLVPNLVTDDEKHSALLSLKRWIGPSISAPDTENRAIVSAANWQYLVHVLRVNGVLTAKERSAYSARLKRKVDKALAQSVTAHNWYREGGLFSVHYHTVTAFHLLAYGTFSDRPAYTARAIAMYRNAKMLALKNGMVEAHIGHRPVGLGAQLYTMMGVLGFAAKDSDASVFLNYAMGTRFFSDPRYPNRLEFHQTIERSPKRFQDDIAIASVTELAQVFAPALGRTPILNRRTFSIVRRAKIDSDFSIVNSGATVVVTDRMARTVTTVLLGSYGNWTKVMRRND